MPNKPKKIKPQLIMKTKKTVPLKPKKREKLIGTAFKGIKKTSLLEPEKKADEELEYLEKVVLGTGDEIFEQDIEEDSNDKKCSLLYETKQPAWIDENDEVQDIQVSKNSNFNDDSGAHLKSRIQKFQQITKRPKWATYSSSNIPQDSVLTKCGNLITKSNDLESGILSIKILKDLNYLTHNEGAITSVQFYPTSTVAMVAGLAGRISLFQVDGKENTKLQSLRFKNFRIHCASFIKSRDEIIVGSEMKKFYYSFNMMTGNTHLINNYKMDKIKMGNFVVSPNDKFIAVRGPLGKIYILCARTKECIDSFKMNCNVNSLTFNSMETKLYSHGDDGEVYIWDMNAGRCVQKFIDDGCLRGTAIDVSPNNAFLACGSSSGVVNVYDMNDISANKYEPLKRLYNLVTPITSVKFNPTSEILSMVSSKKVNAVKLLHISSLSVFSNFPNSRAKLNPISCVDFSPNSGYYALGDKKGNVRLLRLLYYGNY